MDYSSVLFVITLALYGAAAVLYMWGLGGGPRMTNRAASATAALGLAVQSVAIVVRGIELHRAPLTNFVDSLTFAAWALMAIYLAVERKYRGVAALGSFVATIAIIAILFASVLPKGINDSLVPALRSHWSSVHVITCLVGYAGFALAFITAVAYIAQERMLKSKRINVVQKHLPSLETMDRLAYKLVALAFPMLTVGIITGALWAQTAWGSYWSWDPKETWSLITWLVYAAYLHVRAVHGWGGKLANRLLVAGFSCVLITYLGVNFLASGLHKYNW